MVIPEVAASAVMQPGELPRRRARLDPCKLVWERYTFTKRAKIDLDVTMAQPRRSHETVWVRLMLPPVPLGLAGGRASETGSNRRKR